MEQAVSHLETTLRCTPTDAEVAAELEMSSADFHTALRKISFAGMMALDDVLRGSDRTDRSTLGDSLPVRAVGPVDTFEAKEAKQALINAIECMTERDRTVLTMYYYGGLTLTEIGSVLGGVTENAAHVPDPHQGTCASCARKLADRPDTLDRRAVAAPPSRRRTVRTRRPAEPVKVELRWPADAAPPRSREIHLSCAMLARAQ